ncbi:MAG: ribbon-helix-helix domain-containing protein [Parvularculaceae bacterium]
MANDAPISVRLPEETRNALDKAATKTQRSRAFIIKEALDRHLISILEEETVNAPRRSYERLRALRGVGVGSEGGRTAAEIAATIREIRGED